MVAEACTSKFCCDSSLGCFFSSCGLYGGNTCLSRLLGDAGWLDTYPVGVASSLSCGTVDFVCHGQSLPQQDPGQPLPRPPELGMHKLHADRHPRRHARVFVWDVERMAGIADDAR